MVQYLLLTEVSRQINKEQVGDSNWGQCNELPSMLQQWETGRVDSTYRKGFDPTWNNSEKNSH